MTSARILIVDDTPLYRNVVAELFDQEEGYEVVAAAENGREALTLIHLLQPDVVILDVEMPLMDGWETLKAIQLSHPRLAVIMFSSLDPEAGQLIARALAFGAKDYVRKPVGAKDSAPAWDQLREHLLAAVKLHCPKD